MKKIIAKISLFILIGIIILACNSVKRVPENKHLLDKNTITIDGKTTSNENITNLLYQTPNTSILGFRPRLNLYNIAKKNADSSYRAKLVNNPKKFKRKVKWFSEKQVKRIGESFFNAGINNLLKTWGEPPSIIDIKKTEKTATRLKSYYFNLGYYDAKVDYKIDTIAKKKAKVSYLVTKNKASYLDSINVFVSSPDLDTLYQKASKYSLLKNGRQYNSQDFADERERLTRYFRNHGVYNFQQSNITFDLDTIGTGNKVNVDMVMGDYSYREGDSTKTRPFKKFKISEVNIYTENANGRDRTLITDTVNYKDFNLFSTGKLKYKPKVLTDAVFLTKGSWYSDENATLTSRALSNLKNFNYPTIQFKEDEKDTISNSLISNIYLNPLPKRHFGAALDATYNNIYQFGILGTASVSVRNIFKGAEIFEISGRANICSSNTEANSNQKFFNASEYGVDTRLTFPKVLFPFNTDKIIPKNMLPTSGISFGYSKQNKIGLDKKSLLTSLRYDWKPKTNVNARLDLLNIQYVNNLHPQNYYKVYQSSYDELNEIAQKPDYNVNPTYFDDKHNLIIDSGTKGFTNDVLSPDPVVITTPEDYQSVRSLEEKRIRLTENNLIFSTAFSYGWTTKRNAQDNNFYAFKTKLESAGNFLSLIARVSKQLEQQEKNNTILGVVYSQYLKTECEYVKHWDLQHKNIFAVRAFAGIAVPYGNADNIPFSRSYFAGGSNDIRAWQPYSLGPGSTGAINDFNEANMKITLNAEYRFRFFFNSLNAALFIDAGNIWNVLDNVTDPKAIFSGVKSLKNIAVGTGAGLRYDLEMFVVRVDLGFKTYDPSLVEGQKWLSKFGLRDSVLNFGINYPF